MNTDPSPDEGTTTTPQSAAEAAPTTTPPPDWSRHKAATAAAAERVAKLEADLAEARHTLDALRKARELAPGRFARVHLNGYFQMARVIGIAPADNLSGISIAVLTSLRRDGAAECASETVLIDPNSLA